MAKENRYFWLKLHKDFFSSKRIKKLRRMAGGDTYTIIYIKLQLLAVNTGGYLEYTGLEETFAAELALDIDERPEDVQMALAYFLHSGLAEMVSDAKMLLPYVAENTGSEGASAQRMREHRERKALVNQDSLKLPQNATVTATSQSDGESSQCDDDVTPALRRDRVRVREENICAADKPQSVREDVFDSFWAAYPKKKGKKGAQTAFKKVPQKEYPALFSALEQQKKDPEWAKDGGQYIPYPATWLNGRRWEDEMEVKCGKMPYNDPELARLRRI